MKRKDFLEILNLVKPALASKGLIHVLTHFCFDGRYVTTSDTNLTIRTRCDVDINGAIDGNVLLGLLENSRARDVIFTGGENEVQIKLGNRRAKIPTIPSDEFIFAIPSTRNAIQLVLWDKITTGLKKCLLSVDKNEIRAFMTGVTLTVDQNVRMHSTDVRSLSRYLTKIRVQDKKGIFILPHRFCEVLAKITDILKPTKKPNLYLGSSFAMVKFGAQCTIVTKLIRDNNDLDYDNQITLAIGKRRTKPFISIPSKLRNAIKAAQILALEGTTARAVLTIKDNRLRISTRTILGQSGEVIRLAEDHEDVGYTVDLEPLLRPLDDCTTMRVFETCTAFSNDDGSLLYLAAHKI